MYEPFFGLQERPFDLISDPRYLSLTPSHRQALSSLEYGISANTGVTVLIGEAGTGKTTLIRAMLDTIDTRRTRAVYLNNPTLTRSEFLEFLAREFHLAPDTKSSKTRLLSDLERALLALRQEHVNAALIIDEAQSLPHELLEEIRLLANIETSREKLVPIVLAGQPELGERLNRTSLRQLKQRIGLRCQLRPLNLVETGGYITLRISVAGGVARSIFTRDAVVAIHEHSQGIPRLISVICHNSLINGFALNRRPITSDIVREVSKDLDLRSTPIAPIPAVPAAAVVAPRLSRSGPLFSFFSQS